MRAALGWVVAVLVVVGACSEGETNPVVASAEAENMKADHVIFGVRHYINEQGIRRALVLADTAYLYEDSARIDLRRPRITMYDAAGQESAEVTSKTGSLDTRTEGMIARGDVLLVTREGDRRIRTPELHFDPRSDRIWSDSATTMVERGSTIRGKGFTSDTHMRNLRIIEPRGRVEGLRIEF